MRFSSLPTIQSPLSVKDRIREGFCWAKNRVTAVAGDVISAGELSIRERTQKVGLTKMIHIKETFPDEHSVAILVGGVLDRESVDLLEKLCQNHLDERKEVSLHLKDVLHVSREG